MWVDSAAGMLADAGGSQDGLGEEAADAEITVRLQRQQWVLQGLL